MTTTYAATAARILDTATHAGGAYADVQFWESSGDTVSVQNGVVRTVDRTSSTGYGIRVLVDGSWASSGATVSSPPPSTPPPCARSQSRRPAHAWPGACAP